MLWFVWLFFLFSSTHSLSYLDNNQSSFSWVDIPLESVLNENAYPYKGIGCTTYIDDDIYFISWFIKMYIKY